MLLPSKPMAQDELEIRRLIIEKLVMGNHWKHKHVEERNVPKGLSKNYIMPWYHEAKHQLAREGLLVKFKEHGKDLYGLNVSRKPEIMKIISTKIQPFKPSASDRCGKPCPTNTSHIHGCALQKGHAGKHKCGDLSCGFEWADP